MKTNFFAVLALAGLVLAGEPAFGHGGGHKGGGGKGRDAHSFAARGGGGGHRSFGGFRDGGHSFAAVHKGGGHSFTAFRVEHGFRGGSFASANRTFQTRPGIAFGGGAYNPGARGNGRGGYGNNAYGNGYNNDNNHDNGYGGWGGRGGYGYGNDWLFPYYGYGYYGPGYTDSAPYDYSYDTANPVTTEIQQDLAQQGYYQGPIDGIVGPATQTAIAAYQRANGLPPTGDVNGGLLRSLGIR